MMTGPPNKRRTLDEAGTKSSVIFNGSVECSFAYCKSQPDAMSMTRGSKHRQAHVVAG